MELCSVLHFPARTALEQAPLFLPTSATYHLSCTCRHMHIFIENAPTECAYWDDCQPRRVQGKYSQSLVWLHPVTSLKCAKRFVTLARYFRLRGNAAFASDSELRSLTRVLQTEMTRAVDADDGFMIISRFLIEWRFEPHSITCLLEGKSLDEIASSGVNFQANHGVAFTINLSVSKSSFNDPKLEFRLTPAETICRQIEIRTSGTIIAPGMDNIILNLKPVVGGANVEDLLSTARTDQHAFESKPPVKWQAFDRVLSLVRVSVPLWVEPVSLR